MRGFLDEVAEQLYSKYGADISSLRVVFPTRRSRIFFTESLSRVANEPLWQPHWASLDDVISQATPLMRGESIRLISELYKIYREYHNEDFDKFYFWGEVLLSDFDMIDKYRVDAKMLFENVSDIKQLESDLSFLTPEQSRIIAYWSSLKNEKDLSSAKQQFLRVWESLPKIYRRFRERLLSLNIGYTGMIQRSAIERLESGEYSFSGEDKYAIVGFNALTKCEKAILDILSRSTTVEFFWDYDSYYLSQEEQEAGLFIRENRVKFPPNFEISHNNFSSEKSINVVAAASDVLQCKYASKIISDIAAQGAFDKETAIVLTDENLLTPLLYALPAEAGSVNVTMGYPLKQSLSYSFVERLLALQSHSRAGSNGEAKFYYADVVALLSHPYVERTEQELNSQIREQIIAERLISVEAKVLQRSDLLTMLFTRAGEWRSLSEYILSVVRVVAQLPYEGEDAKRRIEFLAIITEHINSLRNSLDSCDIDISFDIYLSLVRRQLQSLRVPFEGEPLEGLQVMGILETRNLDFKRVIILSMNDDNFPGNRLTAPSYVPYGLRSAYGIPTAEHHEGVFAYYFYRLIQRAESVWMIYCSHADDKTTGEPSRYIYQLDYETPFDLKKIDVGVDVNLYKQEPIVIEKVGEVDRFLSQYTDPCNRLSISPSAINRYVACPLRFYFYHIAKLRSSDELSEDVDNSMFGNILHRALQYIYKSFRDRGGCVAPLISETLSKSSVIDSAIHRAICEECHMDIDSRPDSFGGDLTLIRDIVKRYITKGVLSYDSAHSDFEVVGVEKEEEYLMPLPSGESILLRGALDRVDRLASGALRVVDYKSGGKHLEFKSVDSLFNGTGPERQGHVIQTLTYSMMLNRSQGVRVVPSLYYVRFMHDATYSPLLVDRASEDSSIASYESLNPDFERLLKERLAELLDRSVPFVQAEDREGSCAFCDYKDICR